MKHTLIFFFFLFIGSTLFAQQSGGVRIGNGNSGSPFIPTVETINSKTQLEISSLGERISGFEIFNENNELIASAEIESTEETSININGLQQGVYYITVISESGQVQGDTFAK